MGNTIFFWTFQVFILYVILISGVSPQGSSSQAIPISIKKTFSKDMSPFGTKIVTGMQEKISSLESSVEHINNEIKTIEAQNIILKKSVNEQNVMLEQLSKGFSSIESLLTTHGVILDKLKESAYPDDDKAFTFSNETCGGVLHAQSGLALYTSKGRVTSIRDSTLLSPCVWTIQANHRSVIKLTSQLLDLPYTSNYKYPGRTGAYVLEGMTNLTELSGFQAPKVTKLLRGATYTFNGPLIFVVLFIPENTRISALSGFNFQFQYQSQGHKTKKNTFFSHNHLDVNRLENKEFNKLKSAEIPMVVDSSSNQTISNQFAFTSIVISNFTTKLRLRANWEEEKCSNNTFMTILSITDILFNISNINNGTQIKNLCETGNSQEGTYLLTSYVQPIMILISNPIEDEFPLNLSWVTDTEYPPGYANLGYSYHTICGSVLGGSVGYISYKRDSRYRNGERCVWVIVPQPAPTNSIDIVFYQDQTGSHNSKEALNYDHAYIMELTNINGEERVDGPKITKLNAANTTVYSANSREVYIVFYSDSSVTSNGFYINWKAEGDVVKAGDDISTYFKFVSENDGTIEVTTRNSSFFNTLYQVYIFTPIVPSSSLVDRGSTPNYVFGMNLQLNQTDIETSDDNGTCTQERFYVLAPDENEKGILQKRKIECYTPGKATIKTADGIVIAIIKNSATSENRNNVTLNFAWNQEFQEDDRNIVKMENEKCGGVIIGERGILRYKLEQKYNRNEHCIWLLQSPNSTTITLKVMKDGFMQNDRLVVSTIDVDNGTLRNASNVKMGASINHNRTRVSGIQTHETYSFNESLLVISFRPSASGTNGTGFLLRFWSEDRNDNDAQSNVEDREIIDYRLRHSEDRSGRFLYDWNNQRSHAPGKQLHVIAYSTSTPVSVAVQPVVTNVHWTLGVFKKDNESCKYDTIGFYTTTLAPIQMGSQQSSGGSSGVYWEQKVFFPPGNDSTSCPNQVKVTNRQNVMTADYSAFLVIYKLVAYPVEDDSGGDERKIDFTHVQSQNRQSESQWLVEESDDDRSANRSSLYSSYAINRRDFINHVLQSHLRRRIRVHWNSFR